MSNGRLSPTILFFFDKKLRQTHPERTIRLVSQSAPASAQYPPSAFAQLSKLLP